VSSSEYYVKKLSGFSQEVDDALVSPMFYQPTPEGVGLLCEHYSQKYRIDLRMFDFRGLVAGQDHLNFEQFCFLSANRIDKPKKS
jgi:hypothetical protein